MNSTRQANIRKKINLFLDDLWAGLDPHYHKYGLGDIGYWMNQVVKALRGRKFGDECIDHEDILTTCDFHGVKYHGEGASRFVCSIPHAGRRYAFKLCHAPWSEYVRYGGRLEYIEEEDIEEDYETYKDDNQVEIEQMENLCEDEDLRKIVLPMLDWFIHDHAGYVSVWPVITRVLNEDYQCTGKNQELNEHRLMAARSLLSDNHNENVGFWKGLLWAIDLNSRVDYMTSTADQVKDMAALYPDEDKMVTEILENVG